ncbi:hypothetical protein ACQI4F_06945 [Mycolicibacterium vaccae]|uniref:hypothetical protein n=1 Tax=Mycolicibacterium vaccae TaxID=1810 RepID=UPI003CE88EB6
MHAAPALASGTYTASPKPRVSKFLAAGVAVIGAGTLAVTPVSPVVDIQAQNHAVALTASANPTYSSDTGAVYRNLFNQTGANLTNIFQTIAADPFPIVRQLLANQWAYGEKVVNGFVGVPAAFNSWWTGANGQAMLQEAAAHFRAGEFGDGWDRLNRSFVYALNIGSPLYSAFWSQAPSERNPNGNMGIPEQMATNLQQVIKAVFDRNSIVNDITKNVLGPFLAMGFEFALLADAVTGAMREGDGKAVFTALVNAPGVMLNSFLNGYVNPECTGNACDQFPGLINATSAILSIFSTIPKAIAEALKPDPVPGAPWTPPAPAPEALNSTEAVLAASNVVTLDVEPAARNAAPATETATETESATETEPVAETAPGIETEPATEAPVETEPTTEAPVETEPTTEAPVETEPVAEAPAGTEPATEAPAETDETEAPAEDETAPVENDETEAPAEKETTEAPETGSDSGAAAKSGGSSKSAKSDRSSKRSAR